MVSMTPLIGRAAYEEEAERCITELDKLRFRVLSRQPAFWIQAFESLDKSEGAFSNPNVAQVWVDKGTRAVQEGKVAALEEAVRKLWDLLPRSAAQQVRQSALKTGLRS